VIPLKVVSFQAGGDKRCFLRLERQTLTLLPRTGGILFALHTYRAPVATEVADPERRRRFASVLRTMPRDTRDYKRLTPFIEPLLEYLEAASGHGTTE
jgi:hypothetical protein